MYCDIRCCGALRTPLLVGLVENGRGAFRCRPRVWDGEQGAGSLGVEDVLYVCVRARTRARVYAFVYDYVCSMRIEDILRVGMRLRGTGYRGWPVRAEVRGCRTCIES